MCGLLSKTGLRLRRGPDWRESWLGLHQAHCSLPLVSSSAVASRHVLDSQRIRSGRQHILARGTVRHTPEETGRQKEEEPDRDSRPRKRERSAWTRRAGAPIHPRLDRWEGALVIVRSVVSADPLLRFGWLLRARPACSRSSMPSRPSRSADTSAREDEAAQRGGRDR